MTLYVIIWKRQKVVICSFTYTFYLHMIPAFVYLFVCLFRYFKKKIIIIKSWLLSQCPLRRISALRKSVLQSEASRRCTMICGLSLKMPKGGSVWAGSGDDTAVICPIACGPAVCHRPWTAQDFGVAAVQHWAETGHGRWWFSALTCGRSVQGRRSTPGSGCSGCLLSWLLPAWWWRVLLPGCWTATTPPGTRNGV